MQIEGLSLIGIASAVIIAILVYLVKRLLNSFEEIKELRKDIQRLEDRIGTLEITHKEYEVMVQNIRLEIQVMMTALTDKFGEMQKFIYEKIIEIGKER